MSRARVNWTVVVAGTGDGLEDAEDLTYGPYTERRAREVAASVQARFDARGVSASAQPMPLLRRGILEIVEEWSQ